MSLIGSGSYADVRSTKNSKEVIRMSNKDTSLEEDGDIYRSVVQSSSLWLSLPPHPNIIQIISCNWRKKRFSVTMERAHNDLFNILDKSPQLVSHFKKDIGLQILLATAFMHSYNTIHGDINPTNVLVFFEGDNPSVKLSDFDLSRFNDFQNIIKPTTLYYSSPEILLQKDTKELKEHLGAGDVWAACTTIAQMYTKQQLVFPFPPKQSPSDNYIYVLSIMREEYPNDTLIKNLEHPRTVDPIRKIVDHDIPDTFLQGLTPDYTKRPSAQQLVKQLDEDIDFFMFDPNLRLSKLLPKHSITSLPATISWLASVAIRRDCDYYTFANSVHLFIEYCSTNKVTASKLNLVASCCLLLANKVRRHKDDRNLTPWLFYRLCSYKYSDINKTEEKIYKSLGLNALRITAVDYIDIYKLDQSQQNTVRTVMMVLWCSGERNIHTQYKFLRAILDSNFTDGDVRSLLIKIGCNDDWENYFDDDPKELYSYLTWTSDSG